MVLINTGGNKELPTYAISDRGKVLGVTINSNGGTPVAETEWVSSFEGYEYKGESFVMSQTAIATNQTVTYHLSLNTDGGDDYDFMIFCVPEPGISMGTYYGTGSEANLIIKNCGPEVPQFEYLAWIYIFRRPKQGSTHNVFVIGSASNDCVRAPELPTLGTAGQVLSVNSGATGVEWSNIPNELPSTTGNAGKVLTVNSGATGTEWANVPSELPATLGTAGQVLTVNSGVTGVEWANIPSPLNTTTVSVPAAGGTVTCTGMTGTAIVWVSPAPASFDVYAEARCRCTAQATNSLTFTVSETASAAMDVNVVWSV